MKDLNRIQRIIAEQNPWWETGFVPNYFAPPIERPLAQYLWKYILHRTGGGFLEFSKNPHPEDKNPPAEGASTYKPGSADLNPTGFKWGDSLKWLTAFTAKSPKPENSNLSGIKPHLIILGSRRVGKTTVMYQTSKALA